MQSPRFMRADDETAAELVAKCQDLRTLALCELCDRNTGPAGNDSGNLFVGHALMNQRQVFILNLLLLFLQLLLQLWQTSILKLCSLFQIIRMLCLFYIFINLFNRFTEFLNTLDTDFFIIPLCFLSCKFISEFCQFLL